MYFFCGMLAAQTRIAVLPFTPDEKISKSAMSYLTEIFTVEMVNSRKFTVVERARLDAALKEMQMQSGDMFDESSAVELGKMSGAEMVFFGTIFRFGGRELLSIKGMDIKTATLKYAKQEKGGNTAMLEIACKKIASQIINENGGDVVASKNNSFTNTDIIVNGKVVSLSVPEMKLYNKDIVGRWGILPDNREAMWHYYRLSKAGGVACVVVGSVSLCIGIAMFSLMPIGDEIFGLGMGLGIPFTIASCIITPMCAISFSKAAKIKRIYKKTTGEKLVAFMRRSSIGGGYDWDKKEVTVAMAIRL